MKTINRNLKFFLLMLVFSCDGNRKSNNRVEEPQKVVLSATSVSRVDGKFKIDTNVIASGYNIQGIIDILTISVLEEHKTMNEVPVFIRSFLDSISYGKKFTIANPDEDWQVGCTTPMEVKSSRTYYDKKLGKTVTSLTMGSKDAPHRLLLYFGMTDNVALMAYFVGGVGKNEQVNIFKCKDGQVVDFWYGNIHPFCYTKEEIVKNLALNNFSN
jgi:hypothetical protein